MEIDPYLQLAMLLGAFLSGVLLGGVWEMLTAIKILLRAYEPPSFMKARYARPLPLLRRPVPFAQNSVGRRLWRGVIVALLDFLFCALFAVVLILILYRYNDGAFRLSVPVLALCGFALFRFVAVKLLSIAMAYFAFGFAALTIYLCALLALPPKAVRALAVRLVCRPACACYRRVVWRRAVRRSANLCKAQLLWAAEGLSGECPRVKTERDEKKKGRMRHVKKEIRGKDNTRTVGDPHPHSGHIRGGADHRRQSADGVESAPSARRRAARKQG